MEKEMYKIGKLNIIVVLFFVDLIFKSFLWQFTELAMYITFAVIVYLSISNFKIVISFFEEKTTSALFSFFLIIFFSNIINFLLKENVIRSLESSLEILCC